MQSLICNPAIQSQSISTRRTWILSRTSSPQNFDLKYSLTFSNRYIMRILPTHELVTNTWRSCSLCSLIRLSICFCLSVSFSLALSPAPSIYVSSKWERPWLRPIQKTGKITNIYVLIVYSLYRCDHSRWRNTMTKLYSRHSDYATAWAERGLNPGKDKRFFSSTKRPDRLWDPPRLLFNGHRGSFPGKPQPERQINHSPPSRGEVKNDWRYTFTLPYAFKAWNGITLPLRLNRFRVIPEVNHKQTSSWDSLWWRTSNIR